MKIENDRWLLLEVAKEAGLDSDVLITTISYAKRYGMSQQSISRKFAELAKYGYIAKKSTVNGLEIRLTDKAVEELRKCYIDMIQIFEGRAASTVKGKVVSGIGEGRFYTEVEGYKRQFNSSLGIDPFPGTLNLRVDLLERAKFLRTRKPIIVEGFSSEDRTYGRIDCYPAFVGKIKVAALVPERTMHKHDTLELISEVNLRKKLKLVDGDEIIVE